MNLHSKVLPESIQRCINRSLFHLIVEIVKSGHSRSLITLLQSKREWPVDRDIATAIKNATQSILQPVLIVSLLMNLNIGKQAIESSAPISASPGMGLI